jgi:phage shock protein PspC (stress-responsive transcriptional regulator)
MGQGIPGWCARRRRGTVVDMSDTQPQNQGGPRVTYAEVRDVTRLRRSRDDRVVAGVAGGLGRHLDIDPLIVRIVLGVTAFFGGAGVLVYAILLLAVPADDATESIWSGWRRVDPRRVANVGVLLAVIGGGALFIGSVGYFIPGIHGFLVVTVLSLIALTVLVRSRRSRDGGAPTPATTADAPAPPVPPGADPDPTEATTPTDDETDTMSLPEPGFDRAYGTGAPTSTAPPPPAWPPRPRRPRSHLFAMTMASALVACGVVAAYDIGNHVAMSVYPGIVLIAAGAGLIVSVWFGRARLLIPVGLLAAIATTLLTIVDQGPFGDIRQRPVAAQSVRDTYHLGAGRLELDLRRLPPGQLGALDGRTIHVDADVGKVLIYAPEGLDTTISAAVDGGDIRGFVDGDERSGHDLRETWRPVDTAAPNLTIDVGLRYGQVDVHTDCIPTTGGSTDVQACR